MIELEVFDNERQSFMFSSDEPVRIEVTSIGGRVIAYLYEGWETDKEQEPLGLFDGSVPCNTNWRYEGGNKATGKLLALEVIDHKKQHFVVRSNCAMRFDVLTGDKGHIYGHIYEGVEVDMNQEPFTCFDGAFEHGGFMRNDNGIEMLLD